MKPKPKSDPSVLSKLNSDQIPPKDTDPTHKDGSVLSELNADRRTEKND